MNVPPSIPILGQKKKTPAEDVLEGITCKTIKTGVVEFPVDMKHGHPVVGKVTELHLGVQFRFLVRIPLPLGDKREGASLMDMVIEQGFKPEWERVKKSLEQLQLNLQKAAEMAVKTEYNARQAAGAKLKDGEA